MTKANKIIRECQSRALTFPDDLQAMKFRELLELEITRLIQDHEREILSIKAQAKQGSLLIEAVQSIANQKDKE